MGPKGKNSKRLRDESEQEKVVEPVTEPTTTGTSFPSRPVDPPTDDTEDKLCREGEKLSGSALKEFLKKNFLDFADDESEKIVADCIF